MVLIAIAEKISQLKRENPEAKIVVTGCMVDNDIEKVTAIPGIDVIVPNQKKQELVAALFPEIDDLPEFTINHFAAHTRAFVKVQDGCNSFCTYCIIPYVRGRSRSRPSLEIIQEVENLVGHGYQEIVITGINVGDYEDGEKRLADLVKMVDQVQGVRRVRISSIDPDEVDGALMNAVISGTNTCPSMHIVLQSGSNVILKRMNRNIIHVSNLFKRSNG